MNSSQEKIPAHPRVRSYFQIVFTSEKVLFRSNGSFVALRGRGAVELIPRLLPLLDGSNTVEQIVQRLPEFEERKVVNAVELLHRKNILEDAAYENAYSFSAEELAARAPELTFFSYFVPDKYRCYQLLKEARVAILGLGSIGVRVLASLAAAGVRNFRIYDSGQVRLFDPTLTGLYPVDDVGEPRQAAVERWAAVMAPAAEIATSEQSLDSLESTERFVQGRDLVFVCLEGGTDSIYQQVNEACVSAKVPWISARLRGASAEIGPLVVPGETACYHCYQARLNSQLLNYEEHRVVEESFYLHPEETVPTGALAPLAGIAGDWLALEGIKILTRFTVPATCGRLYVLKFDTLEVELHDVLKLPRCPICGPLQNRPSLAPFVGNPDWALVRN